jgi:hypothetical protein
MLPVLVLVLLAVLFPLTAIGKEAWSVIVYIQNNGSAWTIRYSTICRKRDDVIKKSQAVCETHAKKQRPGKYRCEEKR